MLTAALGRNADQSLGQQRGVGIEGRRRRIEGQQRVEALAFQILVAGTVGKHAKGVDNDHLADIAPKFRRDRGKLALRIDDDNAAVFEFQKVRQEQARRFTRAVRSEHQDVQRPAVAHFFADTVIGDEAAEIDGVSIAGPKT